MVDYIGLHIIRYVFQIPSDPTRKDPRCWLPPSHGSLKAMEFILKTTEATLRRFRLRLMQQWWYFQDINLVTGCRMNDAKKSLVVR